MPDYDEQRLPQVQQLRAERANVEAYGDTARLAAIDRQLELLKAATTRRIAAEEIVATPSDGRQQAPQGRRAARRETADAPVADE